MSAEGSGNVMPGHAQINWREHLTPQEAGELEEIRARAEAIDAERHELTGRRRRLYDRVRKRAIDAAQQQPAAPAEAAE